MHILYYSTKCRYSQAFLEELKKTPYVREFRFVCVDPSPSRPPLPRWLKTVPSMVPDGASEPLVGPGPVNNWLFTRRLGGEAAVNDAARKTAERNAPLAQPVYSPEVAPRPTVAAPSRPTGAAGSVIQPATGTDEINPYHPAEMASGRLSDSYSFLDSVAGTSDKIYNPIVRNFETLVNIAAMGFGGGAASAPAPKRSAKEQQQLDAMERYLAARDADIPGPPTRK